MRTIHKRAKGPNVAPSFSPTAVVYGETGGQYAHDPYRTVGPGEGYTWGTGPRYFVGPIASSRPPATAIEVGQPGDFIEGQHTWGPNAGDLGFPHASRWPGYPAEWEQPFMEPWYDAPTAPPPGSFGAPWAGGGPISGQPPYALGGQGAAPGRFMGGTMLESRVSTVFTCVDLISRTLSSMRIEASTNSTPVLTPAWCDNPEPELYVSIVDALKAVINSMLVRGEAFIVATARYADGTVARWACLNPDEICIEPGMGGRPIYTLRGTDIVIPRSELLHLRYQVWPGEVHGVGPLQAAIRNVISADALERWGTSLAVNNGIPTAILSSQVKLTKSQANELKYSWAEAAKARGSLPAILSGGLTYTPLNLKPSDIGLLDLRRFDEQRIAAVFGIPLWLVGLPMQDGLTYSTVEGTFDFLWRATLRAMSANIMQAFSGWAMPRGVWLRQDSESLIRPPMDGRAKAYKDLIETGIMTVDEARVLENMSPMGQATTDILKVTTEGGF